jgi:NADH dehydrogenase
MRIVLVGASGFLGRHLLQALIDDQHQCVVLTRAAERRKTTNMRAGVKLVQADVFDTNELVKHFAGADAVISMAGILNEAGRDGKGFHKVHVELVEAIIKACQETGISRLLHVSALNAGKGSSFYLKTKGEAESLLNSAEGLNVSIFQPSVIFGRGDEFFNRFAGMLQVMPIMPLACPKARLQPVYAGDVVAAMLASLDDPMTWGESYELGGPKCYTLKELVQWTAKTMGLRRQIIGLPKPLSALMSVVMDLVPGKPFSRDNYKSLQTDNVSNKNGFEYFGIYPRAIDSVVPDYLTGSLHQRRLQNFRRRVRP